MTAICTLICIYVELKLCWLITSSESVLALLFVLMFWFLYQLSQFFVYVCYVNVLCFNIVYFCVIVPRAFARGNHVLNVHIVY